MPCQLPADCLNEIFEHLKDDADLYSCLLVNRLWCEVSVRILWKNIQNYNTLITCLPNESKEILHENGIIISTPTSNPPLFDYVTFVKALSMDEINRKIKMLQNHDNNKRILVTQEVFKMFMNQISLKRLIFSYNTFINFSNLPFTSYPGATDCLKNLSELKCNSNVCSEFFCQMSQICHNLQSLQITIRNVISNGLADLISVQQI